MLMPCSYISVKLQACQDIKNRELVLFIVGFTIALSSGQQLSVGAGK